jgi:hypothetical protein
MYPGALDDMIMEPSYVERHFDVDCHVSGRGVRIRDCDNPGNPSVYFENIDCNDGAAIDHEIQLYLEHESIPHCDEARAMTLGVDIGRGPAQCIQYTAEFRDVRDRSMYDLREARERVWQAEYMQLPPSPTRPYPESHNESAPIRGWGVCCPGPEEIREIPAQRPGQAFESWTGAISSSDAERSPLSQTLDRSHRPSRESRRNRHRSYLTWMPYSSYRKCAACFTDSDLKHMRVNVLRVLRYLDGGTHTHQKRAAELWRGFEQSLIRYGITIALECKQRGFNDKSLLTLRAKYRAGNSKKPDWVYWSDLQHSHRAYLLLRDERLFAVKLLQRYMGRSMASWYSHRDFCQGAGICPRREWNMDDINVIRHAVGEVSHGEINLVHENFYRQYGWTQDPAESFRYPEDNICLA